MSDYKRWRSSDGNDLFKNGNKFWDQNGNSAFQTGNKIWGADSTTAFNDDSGNFWNSSYSTAIHSTGDVFWGANGGSADCDIRDVNLVGNNRPDSIGLLVQAFDNSFTNMRIFAFCKGVKIEGGGNLFCNVHPLVSWDLIHSCYDDTVGFWDLENNNTYDRCYADAFSTGWLFGPKSKNAVLHAPMCYWYASTPGHPHTVLRCEGAFRALVTDLWAGFRDDKATNAVLLVGEPGGHGFLDGIRGLRDDSPALNNPSDVFRDYLRGSLHW